MTTSAPYDPQTALETLAAALDPGEFATALVTRTGRRPCLTVTSRAGAAETSVYADQASYWCGSAEPIAAADDPLTAADKVATALRSFPQPPHDWWSRPSKARPGTCPPRFPGCAGTANGPGVKAQQ
jgi:hypothetical protein